MAKQEIFLGTVANDGTGDPLRDAFDKTNDNFTELYNVQGWGYYQDAATSPATIVAGTTPVALEIDGAGANSESSYLPYEIRGSAELWDTTNDCILPIGIGDSYTLRIDLDITAKSGSPTYLDLSLDIGAAPDGTGGAGSILIVEKTIGLYKTPPYNISVGFPIFTLTTFNANGGKLFMSTDTGSVTVSNRSIIVSRISSGQI